MNKTNTPDLRPSPGYHTLSHRPSPRKYHQTLLSFLAELEGLMVSVS